MFGFQSEILAKSSYSFEVSRCSKPVVTTFQEHFDSVALTARS